MAKARWPVAVRDRGTNRSLDDDERSWRRPGMPASGRQRSLKYAGHDRGCTSTRAQQSWSRYAHWLEASGALSRQEWCVLDGYWGLQSRLGHLRSKSHFCSSVRVDELTLDKLTITFAKSYCSNLHVSCCQVTLSAAKWATVGIFGCDLAAKISTCQFGIFLSICYRSSLFSVRIGIRPM